MRSADSASSLRYRTGRPVVRAGTVVRHRLLRRLDDVRHSGIAVVCAGAGYGKTTLLATWADGLAPTPVAWLTIGPEDNDPAAFTERLAGALAASGALAGPERPMIDDVVASLRGRAPSSGRAALVLDDIHLLVEPSALDALAALADVTPDDLLLILCGRSVPSLPGARLPATGSIVDIRREDLAFDESEARALLGEVGAGIERDARFERAVAAAEGWAAGLVMAGLSLRSPSRVAEAYRPSPDRLRQVHRYIDEVVVSACGSDIQEFLERTAVLPVLEPGLCDELTGRSDGLGILRGLVEANALTEELASDPPTFRYHPLLRATLLDRVGRRSRTAAVAMALEAAAALERHGRLIQAADLAVAEHLENEAEDLVRKACGVAIVAGYAATVRRWLLTLPPERLAAQPDLVLVLGRAAGMAGDLVTARAALLQIARTLDEADHPNPGLVIGHQYLQVAMRAWQGALDGVVVALEALVGDMRRHGDDPTVQLLGLTEESLQASLSFAYLMQGRLDEAVSGADRAIVLTELSPPTRHVILSLGVRALAAAWSGDEARARRELELAAPIVAGWRAGASDAIPYLVASAWSGPLGSATADLERAERLARSTGIPLLRALPTLAAVRVHQRRGRLDLSGSSLEVARAVLGELPESGCLPGVLSGLEADLGDASPETRPELTVQELKVLVGLASGKTRPEVARSLHYSVNTVKTHARSAYRKLAAHDRASAVASARAWGLLPPAPVDERGED